MYKSSVRLNSFRFKYKKDSGFPSDEERIGIIAQEIEKVFPFMVTKKKTDNPEDSYLQVKSLDFIYVLIKSAKIPK